MSVKTPKLLMTFGLACGVPNGNGTQSDALNIEWNGDDFRK